MWINPFKASLIVAGMLVSGVYASEGVDDVLRLQRAGLSSDVQVAFVRNSSIPYDPTAIELETMERDGVRPVVMIAMIDRGREIRAETAAIQPQTPAQTAGTSPQYNPTPVVNPQPVPYGDPDVSVQASVVYAPPAEETNISFFYEAMSPHGNWHQHAQHGWVWQPRIVQTQRDWRPYMDDGRWVWTDQGWYWQSDLEWGWAPFHYGRWARDEQYSWVWVPDTQWGPAWVNWRQSEEYYGWAPLPPQSRYEAGVGFSFHNKNVDVGFAFGLGESDYSFVPSDRFFERDYRRVQLPRDRVRNVYNNTTIVNNTYVYNDNRIINNGIPRERVEQRNNRKVETVRIREERAESGRPIPRERQTGNELAVYRPQVKDATPVAPPVAIQRRQERQKTQQAAKQDRVETREQNKENREQAAQQRTDNDAAAKLRLEKEKAARQSNRQENAQARDQAADKAKAERQTERNDNVEAREKAAEAAKSERLKEAQTRDATQDRAKAEREKAAQTRDQAQDNAKAEREKAAQTRDQAQDNAKAERLKEAQQREQSRDQAQEKAKAEREQGAQAREQAAKQRVEQEKAQRDQAATQREQAQEKAKTERAPAPQAREQAQDAAKEQRERAQDAAKAQRDAAGEARQQAQESAKAQRQENAQEKKDERQEKAQDKKEEREEKAQERKENRK